MQSKHRTDLAALEQRRRVGSTRSAFSLGDAVVFVFDVK